MAERTTWVAGWSGRTGGEAPGADSLIELIAAVGDEMVTCPAEGEAGQMLTRREELARVLWTRATKEGDLASAKLLLECLESAGQARSARRKEPLFTPEEFQGAEEILKEWWAKKVPGLP
jgi:hypothetical protein